MGPTPEVPSTGRLNLHCRSCNTFYGQNMVSVAALLFTFLCLFTSASEVAWGKSPPGGPFAEHLRGRLLVLRPPSAPPRARFSVQNSVLQPHHRSVGADVRRSDGEPTWSRGSERHRDAITHLLLAWGDAVGDAAHPTLDRRRPHLQPKCLRDASKLFGKPGRVSLGVRDPWARR